jgi:hypothetical protein
MTVHARLLTGVVSGSAHVTGRLRAVILSRQMDFALGCCLSCVVLTAALVDRLVHAPSSFSMTDLVCQDFPRAVGLS